MTNGSWSHNLPIALKSSSVYWMYYPSYPNGTRPSKKNISTDQTQSVLLKRHQYCPDAFSPALKSPACPKDTLHHSYESSPVLRKRHQPWQMRPVPAQTRPVLPKHSQSCTNTTSTAQIPSFLPKRKIPKKTFWPNATSPTQSHKSSKTSSGMPLNATSLVQTPQILLKRHDSCPILTLNISISRTSDILASRSGGKLASRGTLFRNLTCSTHQMITD